MQQQAHRTTPSGRLAAAGHATRSRVASAARCALALCRPGEVLVRRHSFAHTHLYAGSAGLLAVTDEAASRSVCAVRVDPQTFSELSNARHLLVGERTLASDRVTIEVRRTWRTRVPRLPRPTSGTLASLRARLEHADRGLPMHTRLEPSLLVGRGQGLTPSGDDVVCGALAAAHAWSSQRRVDALWSATVGGLAGTTDLSAQFLRSAYGGHVSGELRALLLALSAGRWQAELDELLRVGHTSGADLAHGVFLLLSTLHDDEENRIDD